MTFQLCIYDVTAIMMSKAGFSECNVPDRPHASGIDNHFVTSGMSQLDQRMHAHTHAHTHTHTHHIWIRKWRESKWVRMSLNMPSIVECHAQTGNHAF